jgi:hypothetical protein
LQSVEHRSRLALASRASQCVGVGRQDIRATTHETSSALQFRDRSIGHAFGHVDSTQHDIRGAEVRIEIERLLDCNNGIVIATGKIKDHSDIHLRPCRHRIEALGAPGEGERFLDPSHTREIERIEAQRGLVARIEGARLEIDSGRAC